MSIDQFNRRRQSNTDFFQRWGIHANELAVQEGVLPATIHMRVRNFGSPFQRRAKPSWCEQRTGRTLGDWARELNVHPMTVMERMKKHGDPRFESTTHTRGTGSRHKRRASVSWEDTGAFDSREWLMPQHPDYANWKSQHKKWEAQ